MKLILRTLRTVNHLLEIMASVLYSVFPEVLQEEEQAEPGAFPYQGRWWRAEPVKEVRADQIHIGTLPLMLDASGCLLESGELLPEPSVHRKFGGSFLISGTPKVMAPVERLAHNRPFLFRETGSAYTHVVEVRSSHYTKPHRSTSTLFMKVSKYKPVFTTAHHSCVTKPAS